VLDFPRWKWLTILGTCLVFILLAVPNLFSESAREKWPGFLPTKTVNLGLDLQGGSYLLLELQFDKYLHEQLTSVVENLRKELIEKKVMYQGLVVSDDKVKFTLLKGNSGDTDIVDIVHKADADLEVRDKGNGNYEVGFTDNAYRAKKLQLLEQSIQIVNRRVNETGTREPIIQRQGDNRIVLQVPGLQDPERLKALLGKTAKMTFHLVDTDSDHLVSALHGAVPPGEHIVYEDSRDKEKDSPKPYLIYNRVIMGGDMLVDAQPTTDEKKGGYAVSQHFTTAGARIFGEFTSNNVNKVFAVVLDNKVITAAQILAPILGGQGQLSFFAT